MTQVWPTIERFLAEHGAAVLVTLAESAGSSPREVGTRMVVRPDGRFSGTIGGGALEWLALAEAQQMMASSAKTAAFRRLNKALGPELGQCCGGRVVVTLERFEGRDLDKVVPLAAAERTGRFLTVSEPGQPMRRSLATGSPAGPGYAKLPDGRIAERFGPNATPLSAPAGAFVAVMTHSHALDLDLAAAALLARRFTYVGVIGSASKRARFAGALRPIGLTDDDIARLICPIGLTEIHDKAPAAIAAAVAAQLLIRRDVIAASTSSSEHAARAPSGASHA